MKDHLPFGENDNSFKTAGEELGLRKLAEDFYRFMGELPEAQRILRMHPKNLDESIDKLARFLCGWLGGPKKYREKYGPIHIPRAHQHLSVAGDERDAWLLCMQRALELQDYSEPFKKYMLEQLFVPAERIRVVCEDKSN